MKIISRLTITNTQSISDWEIIMLKRQKSYAVAALGELKGKVNINSKLKMKNLLVFLNQKANGFNSNYFKLNNK